MGTWVCKEWEGGSRGWNSFSGCCMINNVSHAEEWHGRGRSSPSTPDPRRQLEQGGGGKRFSAARCGWAVTSCWILGWRDKPRMAARGQLTGGLECHARLCRIEPMGDNNFTSLGTCGEFFTNLSFFNGRDWQFFWDHIVCTCVCTYVHSFKLSFPLWKDFDRREFFFF